MTTEAGELPGLEEKVGWLAGYPASFHQLDVHNESVKARFI